MSDSSLTEKDDFQALDKTAQALSELADLLQDYDADSPEVTQFMAAHKDVPEFTDLADEALRLEDATRGFVAPDLPPSATAPAPAPKRLQAILSLAAGFAGIAVVIFGLGSAAYFANETKDLKRTILAQATKNSAIASSAARRDRWLGGASRSAG